MKANLVLHAGIARKTERRYGIISKNCKTKTRYQVSPQMNCYPAQIFQECLSLLHLLGLFFLVVWMLDGQTPYIEIVTNRSDNVMLPSNQHCGR